jgi:Uma2 family endonuclease
MDRTTPTMPLKAGQHLDRATFHALYEAMPHGTRAELIGGVVYTPSPIGYPHSDRSGLAVTWLHLYRFRTPGVGVSDNASVALDDQGEPQPDTSLRILPTHGGQTHYEGKIIAGAPELIIEVTDSSRAIDLGPKLADYERAGVLEYVVIALDPDELIWHVRRGDRLVRISAGPDGLYRSEAFPGLWLDPDAFLADDSARLIAALERGLATAEHAQFAARLAAEANQGR